MNRVPKYPEQSRIGYSKGYNTIQYILLTFNRHY